MAKCIYFDLLPVDVYMYIVDIIDSFGQFN